MHIVVIFWDIYICGEFYSRSEDNLRAFIANMFFVNNYAKDYTVIGVASSWSSCCDLQFGIILTVFIDAIRRTSPVIDSTFTSRVARLLLCFLAISFAFRAFVFDPLTSNLVRMGEMFHFGRLIGNGWLSDMLLETSLRRDGGSALMWVEERYNHTWLSTAPGWEIAQIYSFNLYLPMHTRFGPMVIGGLMACVEQWLLRKGNKPSACQTVVKYVCVGWATSQLILPCIPQPGEPTDIPITAQFFVTVFIRSLAALAGGVLMLTTIVPEDHPFRLNLLADVLSFRLFKYVGTVSYCSYLLHFRILWEIILVYYRPSTPFVSQSGETVEQVMQRIQIYMFQVYILAFLATMFFATLLHQIVELPGLALRTRVLASLRPGCNRTVVENDSTAVSKHPKRTQSSGVDNGKEMDEKQMQTELATVLDDLRSAEAKVFEQEVELKRLRSI